MKGPSLSLLYLYGNMTRLSPLIVILFLTAAGLKADGISALSLQTGAVIWFRRLL